MDHHEDLVGFLVLLKMHLAGRPFRTNIHRVEVLGCIEVTGLLIDTIK